MSKKSCLIIGGGPAGCAAAHLLATSGQDWEITVVERAPFLGAGARTFFHGGHPYTFGPRHFLTQDEKIYRYLDELLPLRRCNEHEFWTYVSEDREFYNFPIHIDDIERMPDREKITRELEIEVRPVIPRRPQNLEEYWVSSVGRTLYKKFIESYSQKMWRIPGTAIDTFNWSPKGTPLKSGPRAAWDSAMSGYPILIDGYNQYFDLAGKLATVHLNTTIECYDFQDKSVWFGGRRHDYDVIVSTISPDVPFGHCYGVLPYIGRDFHKLVLPVEFALPRDVYWIYEAGKEAWTRTVEFKKLTKYYAPNQTLLGIEVPSKKGNHYPLPVKRWQSLADRYHTDMGEDVYCLGRSGCYRYGIDIAACIEQAMELVEILKGGGGGHPVVGRKWRL